MDAYQLASEYARHTNKCIFLTGKAGTGKTTFLRNLSLTAEKQMAIIAPTGVAAINAGGSTIHSLFQLPPQLFLPTEQAYAQLFAEMQMRKQKIQLLRNLELLVIDEISMVRADLLDAIDAVLRHYRHRNQPFGGVQMLFIGDLFQLSPVARYDDWNLLRSYYEGPYFFQSRVFREVNPVYIELDRVFRQQNASFVDVLNQVRNNCLTSDSRNLLNSHYEPCFSLRAFDNQPHCPIILSTHNQKVDRINEEELERLQGKEREFTAKVTGNFPESMYPIDKVLTLKIGARVMFVKNDSSPDKRYYNGKLGVVTSWTKAGVTVQSEGELIDVETEIWDNVRYEPDAQTETVRVESIGSFEHIPLRLAWAITIHKSQGLTFDDVVIDAEDAFAAGQVYVALSRCRTLEGITLLSKIPESALTNAQDVLRYVGNQPGIDIVNAQLPASETEYLVAILTNLFDFREMLRKVNWLRAITHREAAYSEETESYLNGLKTAIEEQVGVGERFQNQLRTIILSEMTSAPAQSKSIASGKEESLLETRLRAAEGYFVPILTNLFNALKGSPCTTENKESRVEFEEVINDLLADVSRFLFIVPRMAKKPCIQQFHAARTLFRLPSVHISASTEKQERVEDSPNPQLLRALLARRREIADDAGVERYMVARTDSLKDIARRLPLTKRELMKTKDFGKKKYDIWGDEILRMVQRYAASRR